MSIKGIMRRFRLDEISAVDSPAQKKALAAIMKRDDTPPADSEVRKRMRLTTATDGHSHLIDDAAESGGYTQYGNVGGPDGYAYHSHPWVKDDKGNIVIGMAAGHTHEDSDLTAEVVEKNESGKKTVVVLVGKEYTRTQITESVDMLTPEQIAALQKNLERANSIIALDSSHRAYFDALPTGDQDGFLAKSGEARNREITMAKAADPVVYTTTAGQELRKSAGEFAIAQAKRADELQAELTKSKTETETATFAKRAADELGNLPGDEATKVAVLKAIAGITDETARTAAAALLKAGNDAMTGAFVKSGGTGGDPKEITSGVIAKNDAEAKLDALVKKHSEDHKMPFAKAYTAVLDTAEGKKLYDATQRAA